MNAHCETLIVGGGMAGIFCAMRLQEAGLAYRMVAERFGGRVMFDPQLDVNFGAAFYFENYHHVRRIITPGPRVIGSLSQVMFHLDDTQRYPALGLRVLRHARGLFGFWRFLRRFAGHYDAYKTGCERSTVKEALAADPFLRDLAFATAEDLLDELGVKAACRESVSLFAYACTGEKIDRLSAFDYCYVAQGLFMPIHYFRFDAQRVLASLGEVTIDRVESVRKTADGHLVVTRSGAAFSSTHLVVATTATEAQRLLALPSIRSPSKLHAYLVRGEIESRFRGATVHLFTDDSPIIFLARREEHPGQFLIYSTAPLALSRYFATHEVLGMQEWPQALYAHPAIVLDQDLGDGLYLAGDHNGMGMEPAAISGIFAANRIIESAGRTARPVQRRAATA